MPRRNPYRTCPICGAHLDPGEQCDCQDKKEEAAPGAANTKDGKGGAGLTSPRSSSG